MLFSQTYSSFSNIVSVCLLLTWYRISVIHYYFTESSKEPGKAVIKIKVPKGMITSGTSDKDLSGLVGRLLDQELKAQKSKTGL